MTEVRPTSLPSGRYGPAARTRPRRLTVLLMWSLGLAAVGLAAWIGLTNGNPPVRWTDVGFVLADDSVEIVYDITRPDPSLLVHCRLEALNQQFAQVGLRTVEVSPSDQVVQRLRSTVETAEPAVTGVVNRCWVP